MKRTLRRKLLRDLLSLRTQLVTIAVLVVCGVSLFIASWRAYRSLQDARDSYYREYAFAEIFCELKRAPLEVAERIARLPGIARAEPRIVIDGLLDLGEREPAVGRFISVPSGTQPGLNRIYLRQGRLPAYEREIEVAIHEGFARANGIRLGERLVVLIQGRREPVTVVGIALSPEYVYALSPAAPLPDDRHFGIIWMPAKPLERLARMEDSFNSISVTTAGGDPGRTKAAMDEVLKRYGGRGAYGRDTQPSSRFVDDEILQQKSSAVLTPAIFLGVAAFLSQVIASRLVGMHRSQIATLKAVGYSDSEVALHYLTLIVCMMLAGALPGIGLGAALGQLMAKSYENFFRFPQLDFSLSFSAALLGLVAGVLPGILGAWTSIRSVFRLPPSEAMRPPAPPAFHGGLMETLGLQSRLAVRQRIVFRNLLFRPIRLVLSVFGMATAIAVVVASVAWKDIVQFLLDAQFQRVQREDLSVTFVRPVKQGGLQEVLGLPGVLDVEGYRVVPVRVRMRNQKRELLLTGWPERSRMRQRLAADLRVIPLPAEGLLLSRFFEKAWSVRTGELVELETLEGKPVVLRLPVAGFTDDLVGISASMSIRSLWKALGEEPGYNLAAVKIDPRRAVTLYARLKELPLVATVSFKESLYRGFQESMGTMIRVSTGILTVFALAIALGVIYNAIRVSFSERSWEMASLRVLGFSSAETFRMLLAEVGIQAALSVVPGCALGFGLTHLVLKGVNTETFGFPVVIERTTYATAILVMLGAFTLSAALVRRMIMKLSLAEALKSRD